MKTNFSMGMVLFYSGKGPQSLSLSFLFLELAILLAAISNRKKKS
ncbi:hypothetical protein BACCIP111883_03740 [Sutcliffiella rhizosphaerae]|uniref:Uncharacterized protein n=1 Tax=Sutcliffiella rhizosphaerae TaxID=2880967 RepID=A0ABM8YSQ1_9BACI|nr:hypothetical protein BACCIP111883_03740 [Sutcliffiella rhizosphaerae]